MGCYLAIDIGTTEGRHILGHYENEKLRVEEIYRFDIKTVEGEAGQCWDLEYLFNEIKKGIRICRELDKLPILVGIDTWLLDFVLLDEENKVINQSMNCNNQSVEETRDKIINQLRTFKENNLDDMDKIKSFLMIPDYLNFLLTGCMQSEYTMVMTTQLVDPITGIWDEQIIKELGYSKDIFQEIRRPGAVLGNLSRGVTEEIGYDCIIILPATNAYNSAMFALSPKENNTNPYEKTKSCSFINISQVDKEYSASSIGNLLVQLIISHEVTDVQAAQKCALNSFVLKE